MSDSKRTDQEESTESTEEETSTISDDSSLHNTPNDSKSDPRTTVVLVGTGYILSASALFLYGLVVAFSNSDLQDKNHKIGKLVSAVTRVANCVTDEITVYSTSHVDHRIPNLQNTTNYEKYLLLHSDGYGSAPEYFFPAIEGLLTDEYFTTIRSNETDLSESLLLTGAVMSGLLKLAMRLLNEVPQDKTHHTADVAQTLLSQIFAENDGLLAAAPIPSTSLSEHIHNAATFMYTSLRSAGTDFPKINPLVVLFRGSDAVLFPPVSMNGYAGFFDTLDVQFALMERSANGDLNRKVKDSLLTLTPWIAVVVCIWFYVFLKLSLLVTLKKEENHKTQLRAEFDDDVEAEVARQCLAVANWSHADVTNGCTLTQAAFRSVASSLCFLRPFIPCWCFFDSLDEICVATDNNEEKEKKQRSPRGAKAVSTNSKPDFNSMNTGSRPSITLSMSNATSTTCSDTDAFNAVVAGNKKLLITYRIVPCKLVLLAVDTTCFNRHANTEAAASDMLAALICCAGPHQGRLHMFTPVAALIDFRLKRPKSAVTRACRTAYDIHLAQPSYYMGITYNKFTKGPISTGMHSFQFFCGSGFSQLLKLLRIAQMLQINVVGSSAINRIGMTNIPWKVQPYAIVDSSVVYALVEEVDFSATMKVDGNNKFKVDDDQPDNDVLSGKLFTEENLMCAPKRNVEGSQTSSKKKRKKKLCKDKHIDQTELQCAREEAINNFFKTFRSGKYHQSLMLLKMFIHKWENPAGLPMSSVQPDTVQMKHLWRVAAEHQKKSGEVVISDDEEFSDSSESGM